GRPPRSWYRGCCIGIAVDPAPAAAARSGRYPSGTSRPSAGASGPYSAPSPPAGLPASAASSAYASSAPAPSTPVRSPSHSPRDRTSPSTAEAHNKGPPDAPLQSCAPRPRTSCAESVSAHDFVPAAPWLPRLRSAEATDEPCSDCTETQQRYAGSRAPAHDAPSEAETRTGSLPLFRVECYGM